ncbi:MAG: hypothetical protein ACQCN5_00930 [Candidatus Bathyarchaeia archaeon]|jgi:hypothetical protein
MNVQRKPTSAKQASIMAMTAALYAVFFAISYSITIPNFTLLYLPIILLGVFPLWFGWSGLVGSMIGAYIGGVFVEGLPLHFAVAESICALIIFGLNWLLIPKFATEAKSTKSIITLAAVYAVTLLAGTSYVLWQLSIFGVFPIEIAQLALPPTYALNLPIAIITCTALIRAITPKLKSWGNYSGSFSEWRQNRKAKLTAKTVPNQRTN